MKTVVIDPGHGGYDNGAVNGSRREKNDNLRLGLALRDRLRQLGYNVIMTRDTDVFVPLLERSRIANSADADLFISLHRNSYPDPAAAGVENYIQYGAPEPNRTYAQNVLSEVVNSGVQVNRGVKQQDFSVLRNTYAPAQLLELGFISNNDDNTMFDRYFYDYVNAIARGIQESLGDTAPAPAPQPPSRGDATIRSIQNTLNSRYNTGLAADGIYGPLTKRALVRGLQTELNNLYGAGLSVDGIFGTRTRAAIRNVRNGQRGNIVYLLQAMLYIKGYKYVVPDGIFGAKTEQAVRAFQSTNGLSADGIAGKATFSALFS